MSTAGTWKPETDPTWRLVAVDEEGRECSQVRCHRPAVSVFMRDAYYHSRCGYRSRRWFCCDLIEHQYGRMTRYGNVWRRVTPETSAGAPLDSAD